MSNSVRCGLIQTKNEVISPAGGTDKKLLEEIKEKMLNKHLEYTKQAAEKGVKILCYQEIFNGPYFCAEQQTCWYETAEEIPNGPTIKLMQETAKKYGMVLIVPIYEKEQTGVYYNSAAVIDADGKYLGYMRNVILSVFTEIRSVCINNCCRIV